MTPPKAQRVRAFGIKTKTGCLNCKKRRVKCDETRPACNKCTKLLVECPGYQSPTPAATGSGRSCLPRRNTVPICPRPAASTDALAICRALGPSPSARFQNQSEYAYFRFFQEKSTRTLAGPYRDNLWDRIVLQACHEEPSIRHIAASIGALELTKRHAPAQMTTPADSHFFYALNHYGKGIAKIRRVIESPIPHIEKALNYLQTELARLGQPYCHLATPSSTPGLNLENDIITTFVRLEGGLLARPSAFITRRVPQFLVACDFSDKNLPPSFDSIEQARKYLEQAHFSHMPELIRWWRKATTQEGLLLSDEVLSIARETSARVSRWLVVFRPMFERAVASHARGGPLSGEFALQVQALMSNLTAQVFWSAADDAYNEHHENRSRGRDLDADCNTINALCRDIAAEPGFQKTFVWNNSILQALMTVVTAAPEFSTRVEAVEILKSVRPRREGVFDSVALVEVGEYALRVVTDQNVCGKVSSGRFYININA